MIYLITNTHNGKRYVGKTTQQLEKRWYQHRRNAASGKNTWLYKAIRKYGEDAFTVVPVCEGGNDEERAIIAQLKPEYNLTTGGDGGDTSASPNYQSAMAARDYRGARNPNYGKRGEMSPNHGKVRSPQQIQNHRDGYKGKRVPVRVDGVDYDSVSLAAKTLQRSERYVRLHDELNNWTY